MGRGRGRTIKSSDLANMSPAEQSAVNALIKNRNNGTMPMIRIEGKAVVRSHETGNVRYGEGATPGNYNEDRL